MLEYASHKITVQPSIEPVSASQVRRQLRRDDHDEDTLLQDYVTEARQLLERVLERQLITATYELKLDDFPGGVGDDRTIYVPRPPLVAVSSITYLDTEGDSQTLAAANYRVDSDSEPGRITEAEDESWPDTDDVTGAVTVTHTAGYGTSRSDVPAPIRRAIIVLVAHLDRVREGEEPIPGPVFDLIEPYMMQRYV